MTIVQHLKGILKATIPFADGFVCIVICSFVVFFKKLHYKLFTLHCTFLQLHTKFS